MLKCVGFTSLMNIFFAGAEQDLRDPSVIGPGWILGRLSSMIDTKRLERRQSRQLLLDLFK